MNKIKIEKISDVVVKPIKTKINQDTRLPIGYEMFREPYPNIAIVAKKKSGKTQLISNIIDKCASPNTQVIVIASTVNKDDTWKEIRRRCKKRGVSFHGLTEIVKDKVDFLNTFMNKVMNEGDEESLDEEDDEPGFSSFEDQRKDNQYNTYKNPNEQYEDENEDENSRDDKCNFGEDPRSKVIFKQPGSMKEKSNFIEPEYLLILDDVSNELKLPSLRALLKKNRHARMKCIISTQYLLDLLPEQLKQFDYLILFKGQEDKLPRIKRDGDLSIDLPILEKIYHHSTDQKTNPYGFLYIDTKNEEYRKNFNQKYNIHLDK